MVKEKKYRGICSTCRNAPTCIMIKNSIQTVWQCEEFEVYPFRPVIKNSKIDTYCEDKNNSKYLGLCRSCENRETCIYIKQDLVVWHCELYI